MRKLYWVLPLLIVISCSKGKKVEVSGIVRNTKHQKIYLDEQGIGGIRHIDSTWIRKDDRFKLNDRIQYPTFYNLHLGDREIIPLLLQPGTRVKVHTEIPGFSSGYSISGSVESQEILELNKRLARTRQGIDSLNKLIEANTGGDAEFLSGINEAYQDIIQKQRRYSIGFVLDHMTSMVAIYALYQKINDNDFVLNENMDIQMLKITSHALDTIYPESEHVQALKRNTAQLEQDLYTMRLKDIISRSEYITPDIRLPDPYGDTISLRSLKGKVVLLSFWASWDDASVAQNIQLKNLYDKYKGQGFEIYQVSFDSELDAWMKAINYDELPWINVSELSYPESYVGKVFNIQELPVSFLINREGKIVGKNFALRELNVMIPKLLN